VWSVWPWVLALGLGASKTFWSQATQAEVYALHLVLVTAWLGWAWKGWRESPWRSVWIVSLLLGIGLAHQQTMMLFGLGWGFVVWQVLRVTERPWRLIALILPMALVGMGLAVYGMVQLRALADPSINWGDPETFRGMAAHWMRKQYGTLSKQPRSWGLMLEQLALYGKSLSAQWGWWGWWPGLAGLVFFWRRHRRLAGWAAALWVLYSVGLVLSLNYKVTPQYEDIMRVFFIPSYVGVLGGWAFWFHQGSVPWMRRMTLGIAGLMLVGVPVSLHLKENHLGRHVVGYFYGRNILEMPDVPSYLFVAQDNEVFTVAYLQMVEGWRTKTVTVYDELGCVFPNIYGEYFLAIGKAAHQARLKTIQRRGLETTDRPIYYVLASAYRKFEDLQDIQQGIVFTAHPRQHRNGEGEPWRRMETSALHLPPEGQEYLVRDILAQYHLLLGDWHRQREERDLAMRAFQRAARVGETVDWVPSNVGSALMREGRLAEAIAEYERAVWLNPRKAAAHYDLAIAYNKAGRTEEAIAQYRQALDLDPRYASARNNLGNIYLRQGRVEEAIREYRAGIEADPENVQAIFNLGGALEELKRYDEAESLYRQALERNPRYVEAMNNLAGLYLQRGEMGRAVEWYQKALAMDPQYVDARYNLGFAYFLAAQQFAREQRRGEARQWLERATAEWREVLKIQSDHRLAHDRLRDAASALRQLNSP